MLRKRKASAVSKDSLVDNSLEPPTKKADKRKPTSAPAGGVNTGTKGKGRLKSIQEPATPITLADTSMDSDDDFNSMQSSEDFGMDQDSDASLGEGTPIHSSI